MSAHSGNTDSDLTPGAASPVRFVERGSEISKQTYSPSPFTERGAGGEVSSGKASLVTRREWARVLIFAAAVAILILLPSMLGWMVQGDDRVFTGSLIGVEDGNSYLAKMRLGARGEGRFSLFYTAEEHEDADLLFLPYFAAGRIVGLFVPVGDPALPRALAVTFNLLRAASAVLLIVVMYRFVAVFLRSPRMRILAVVIATLGGGVGWLLTLLGQSHWLGTLPPDFYIPEDFTFLALLGAPHIALGRAMLLLGLLALFEAVARFDHRRAWLPRSALAGACWVVTSLCVPLHLVTLYAALGLWGALIWLRERAFPRGVALTVLATGAITAPPMLIMALNFIGNETLIAWQRQAYLPSPHPAQYAAAFLVLGLLAWIGGRWAWQQADRPGRRYLLLPVSWALIVPVLVYLPIASQRRLSEAILVMASILAVMGLGVLLPHLGRSSRIAWKRTRTALLIVLLPSSLFLLLGCFLAVTTPAPPLFHPAAEIDALAWLDDHAERDAVILSTMQTGNVVPVWADLRTYLGHDVETLDSPTKRIRMEQFYADTLTLAERQALYTEMRIRYVFYGPAERALYSGGEAAPRWTESLRLIYDDGAGYQIYEVGLP